VSDFADWRAAEDQDGITRLCTVLGALVPAAATPDRPTTVTGPKAP
jgi:TetR/AcrR family transcriptional repressor of nem operon